MTDIDSAGLKSYFYDDAFRIPSISLVLANVLLDELSVSVLASPRLTVPRQWLKGVHY